MRLFVYGTLRQGCTNHNLIFGSRYLGPVETKDPYVMVTQKSRSYPYIFRQADLLTYHVKGELYEVTEETMRRLDVLEGHPDHYRRQQITVIDRKDQEHECFAYVVDNTTMIADILEGLGTRFVFVRHGDWIECKPITVSKE